MRLLFDVLHPAHVHFFAHLARHAVAEGGEVLFTARRKDVTVELLEAYGFPYEVLTAIGGGRVGLAKELALRVAKLVRRVRSFRPDLLMGIMGPAIAPVGRITGVPSWVYYDTETATATNRFVYPLCSRLFLPDSYQGKAPRKAERYPGYHELSYLHPNRFEVDRSVREEAGLEPEEPFAVLRLVSWEASHDVGDTGFAEPARFGEWLASQIRVVVTGERGVPTALQHLALRLPPHRIHHLLAEASMYVGEGATMAAEAAILGTPAVFVHTARLGYMLELEARYDLLINTPSQGAAERAIKGWLADPEGTAATWTQRREHMLSERIDVGEWLVKTVEAAARARGA